MGKRSVSRCIVTIMVIGAFSFIACGGGGGGGDAEPATRLAFVTSTSGTGDLSSWADAGGEEGLAAADTVCQARAAAGSLPGTFVAFISDSSDDAYCRAHGLSGKKADNCGQAELPATAGPWVKVDGTPFAAQLDVALDDGVIYTPANVDELGSSVAYPERYFTGSTDGGIASANVCADSSTAGALSIGIGITDGTTYRWYSGAGVNCSHPSRLLCLETGDNNTMPAFGDTGKVVFLSSASGNGRLGSWAQAGGQTGIAAGDAICQSLASDAGLARASSFKAWLSDSETNAGERFGDGPWVRLDGIKVAESMSAFTNTGPLTALGVTEKGDYLSVEVFTGTHTDGTHTTDESCLNWTDGTSGLDGGMGLSSFVSARWTYWRDTSCDEVKSIYCFED
jgi:hypothetical protein